MSEGFAFYKEIIDALREASLSNPGKTFKILLTSQAMGTLGTIHANEIEGVARDFMILGEGLFTGRGLLGYPVEKVDSLGDPLFEIVVVE